MSLDGMLEEARDLDTGRIRSLALDLRNIAVKLDKALTDERTRRRVDALRRELVLLELRLATPVVAANGGQTRAAAVDYDPATVRAWAATVGMKVPAKGRYLPDDVVAAWRIAHIAQSAPEQP